MARKPAPKEKELPFATRMKAMEFNRPENRLARARAEFQVVTQELRTAKEDILAAQLEAVTLKVRIATNRSRIAALRSKREDLAATMAALGTEIMSRQAARFQNPIRPKP